MNKSEFLQTLCNEQIEWEAFLGRVQRDVLTQPGACGRWSVKDVVAHVGMWERYVTAMVSAHERKGKAALHEMWGEFVPSSELQDDALNEWYAEQLQHRSFDQILGQQREIRAQLVGTVEAISEPTLTALGVPVAGLAATNHEPLWQAIKSMSYGHVNLHKKGSSALSVMDSSHLSFLDPWPSVTAKR